MPDEKSSVKHMTEKQKRFCDEYLACLNATQAAIKAGYAKKNARQTGSENLSKPYIREYIDQRLAEKEEKLIAKQDEILQYFNSLEEAFAFEYDGRTIADRVKEWKELPIIPLDAPDDWFEKWLETQK